MFGRLYCATLWHPHLVYGLQFLVLRFGLQQCCSVDVRLGRNVVLVFQIQPCYLEVDLHLEICTVDPERGEKQGRLATTTKHNNTTTAILCICNEVVHKIREDCKLVITCKMQIAMQCSLLALFANTIIEICGRITMLVYYIAYRLHFHFASDNQLLILCSIQANNREVPLYSLLP